MSILKWQQGKDGMVDILSQDHTLMDKNVVICVLIYGVQTLNGVHMYFLAHLKLQNAYVNLWQMNQVYNQVPVNGEEELVSILVAGRKGVQLHGMN